MPHLFHTKQKVDQNRTKKEIMSQVSKIETRFSIKAGIRGKVARKVKMRSGKWCKVRNQICNQICKKESDNED